jgi:hypothetical protein
LRKTGTFLDHELLYEVSTCDVASSLFCAEDVLACGQVDADATGCSRQESWWTGRSDR